MSELSRNLIRQAYDAFNSRNIDRALQVMHHDVHWPNGWEGGYVNGHEALREYWTRQWKEIDPVVTPVSFRERSDGRVDVEVKQLAKDKQGKTLFNGIVHHVYLVKDGLISNMEIEHADG